MARNSFPRTRALVAGVLFVSWIGFLAYLVSITRDTIPLAGPQIQTADLVILADVEDEKGRPGQKVRVHETLRVRRPEWPKFKVESVLIEDLPFCGPKQGYQSKGLYVIPLHRLEPGPIFRVKMLPIVPGYYPMTSECSVSYGDDKTAVSRVLSETTGVSKERVEEMFDKPSILVPNLPFYFGDSKQFDSRIRKAGGHVDTAEPGETRIYRATWQVLNDVQRLLQ
jgi:hypothetical protein